MPAVPAALPSSCPCRAVATSCLGGNSPAAQALKAARAGPSHRSAFEPTRTSAMLIWSASSGTSQQAGAAVPLINCVASTCGSKVVVGTNSRRVRGMAGGFHPRSSSQAVQQLLDRPDEEQALLLEDPELPDPAPNSSTAAHDSPGTPRAAAPASSPGARPAACRPGLRGGPAPTAR